MSKYQIVKTEAETESVDLGDATANTLGNNTAGVRETLGPRRYRN